MLAYRLIFGVLFAAVVLGLLLLDGWLSALPASSADGGLSRELRQWLFNGAVCAGLALVLAVLATREVLRFFRSVGQRPFPHESYIFAGGLVVGPYVAGNLDPEAPWRNDSWGMFWIALALGTLFLRQAVYRKAEHALTNLATTIFVIYYCGLFGFMIKLRMEIGGWLGVTLLLFSIAVVKMTDVGAFFTGRVFGRTPLIPWLSPRKTWEGLFGGIVIAVAVAVAVGLAMTSTANIELRGGWAGPVVTLMVFGFLMAVVSVAGDLFASLLKRDAAVKDSGQSIPGFGGILDILDSPFLSAPLAWFFWTRLVVFPPVA